jgi:hypothetical protein
MFWEDPAELIGWPLLVVGGLGILLVFATMVAYSIKPS